MFLKVTFLEAATRSPTSPRAQGHPAATRSFYQKISKLSPLYGTTTYSRRCCCFCAPRIHCPRPILKIPFSLNKRQGDHNTIGEHCRRWIFFEFSLVWVQWLVDWDKVTGAAHSACTGTHKRRPVCAAFLVGKWAFNGWPMAALRSSRGSGSPLLNKLLNKNTGESITHTTHQH